MIFPKLTLEKTLQVDDKTRLDASLSFVTPDETISLIEIKPEATEAYVDVYTGFETSSEKWYLDWAYETDGSKVASVRVTTIASNKEKTHAFDILLEVDDALFSDDNDLVALETEILRYLPSGKNSYKYVHREAQSRVIRYLDTRGIRKRDTTRFTKLDLVDKSYIRDWSKYEAMIIIFENQNVINDDIFEAKMKNYRTLLHQEQNNSVLRLDYNDDGTLDDDETVAVTVKFLGR